MRLLISSTLDSSQPFGPFTRPYYLGLYLAKQFEVHQLGLDCSAVTYTSSTSVRSRRLRDYIRAIRDRIDQFAPDVVYAQETLPAIAALIAVKQSPQPQPKLVFDFHTLSAFEYWTQLRDANHKAQQVQHIIKTYFAQGTLIGSQCPIIAASQATIDLIPQWYPIAHAQMYSVGNGVAEDLLNLRADSTPDPFAAFRPAKIIAVIAPKASDYAFPSNDMSVEMTVQIARILESEPGIRFVIIGRDATSYPNFIPSNVSFTGFLPTRADFLTHLTHINIGLLPFPEGAVAGGARNKALDYFACRKLVISTPEGLRGLEAFQHQVCLTSYAVPEIAQTLLKTCHQFEDYQSIADAAYQLVRQQYSWSAMAEQVSEILKAQMRHSTQELGYGS
jgi:glycosyltransferase involved in cell wall biosynthesis